MGYALLCIDPMQPSGDDLLAQGGVNENEADHRKEKPANMALYRVRLRVKC